jgi:protein CLEC16A
MASTIAAALFHQPDCPDREQETPNGCVSEHDHGISEKQVSSTSARDHSNGDKLMSLSSANLQCLPDHPPASEFCQGNTLRYAAVAVYECLC